MAATLEETAAAHHHAFEERDGADPEWSQWYAAHAGSRLAELLGRAIAQDDLAARLNELDRRYREEQTDIPWAEYYAAHLVGDIPEEK